jgi:hypothetical protein
MKGTPRSFQDSTGDGLRKKSALRALKASFSCAGLPMTGALLHDFDRQTVTSPMARQAAGKMPVLRGKQPSAAKAEFIR